MRREIFIWQEQEGWDGRGQSGRGGERAVGARRCLLPLQQLAGSGGTRSASQPRGLGLHGLGSAMGSGPAAAM